MALVVLLRGVNVGGHRTFRPATLADQLRHLNAVNVGATGAFVVRKPIGRRQLRAEIARRIPFEAEITICEGREITGMLSHDHFSNHPARANLVRFVSVLSRLPRLTPKLPMSFPFRGQWLMQVLERDGRFVFGMYRRDMRVIGCLGELDRVFGVPATTRSCSTFTRLAKVLNKRATYDA